jgi:hypothetical protein
LSLVLSLVTFSSFDAVVHMTPSVTVLVVSVVVLHLLVPPVVHLVVFVHVVILSGFDVAVHVKHLAVVSIVVRQTVVPPVCAPCHVRACSQFVSHRCVCAIYALVSKCCWCV